MSWKIPLAGANLKRELHNGTQASEVLGSMENWDPGAAPNVFGAGSLVPTCPCSAAGSGSDGDKPAVTSWRLERVDCLFGWLVTTERVTAENIANVAASEEPGAARFAATPTGELGWRAVRARFLPTVGQLEISTFCTFCASRPRRETSGLSEFQVT